MEYLEKEEFCHKHDTKHRMNIMALSLNYRGKDLPGSFTYLYILHFPFPLPDAENSQKEICGLWRACYTRKTFPSEDWVPALIKGSATWNSELELRLGWEIGIAGKNPCRERVLKLEVSVLLPGGGHSACGGGEIAVEFYRQELWESQCVSRGKCIDAAGFVSGDDMDLYL